MARVSSLTSGAGRLFTTAAKHHSVRKEKAINSFPRGVRVVWLVWCEAHRVECCSRSAIGTSRIAGWDREQLYRLRYLPNVLELNRSATSDERRVGTERR